MLDEEHRRGDGAEKRPGMPDPKWATDSTAPSAGVTRTALALQRLRQMHHIARATSEMHRRASAMHRRRGGLGLCGCGRCCLR
eukprot:5999511-Pyramimonas_sp.AAC.1